MKSWSYTVYSTVYRKSEVLSDQRSSLLDLVFTSDIDSIHFVQHHSPLGSSDHECLSWQYECLFDNPSNEGMPTAYNFWRESTQLCVKSWIK